MEFSQSFSLGNSTFLNIEKKALEKNGLETIEESPKKMRKKEEKTKNFSMRRKQKFQRCKSDSVLQESNKAPRKSTETYSQFFKSEFNVTENQDQNTYVNISEIQKICDNVEQNTEKDKLFQSNDGFSQLIQNNISKENSRMQSLSRIDFEKLTQAAHVSEDQYVPGFTEIIDCNDLENYLEKESTSNTGSSNLTDFFDSTAPEVDENLKDIINFDESSFLGTIPRIQELEKSKKAINSYLRESQQLPNNASKYIELQSEDPEKSRKRTTKLNISESISRFLDLQSQNIEEKVEGLDDQVAQIATEDLFSEDPLPPELKEEPQKIDLENLRSISAWSLPAKVVKEYEKKGVKKMFQWQVECLCNPKVLFDFKNLVYSAPTSAGKTLVSEILMIKTILERNKKALMILPFISVVREKMFYLSDLLSSSGYRVEGFFGGYSPPGGFDSINLAICTIEKANSIINKLMEQCRLDEIGVIVVDEIHLVSDPSRGYILELLLAKVLYMSEKYGFQIQVVTMSATLANAQLLTKWLNAEKFVTDFRPVQLQEMIKIGNKVYDKEMKLLRTITSEIPNDTDMVHHLVIETLAEGCSVVVFCPTKDWCEKLSISIARSLHNFLKTDSELSQKVKSQLIVDNLKTVKARLSDIPTGLDSVLGQAICYGCSYHHAGLTTEERDIIEECFKIGFLKVIVATSTLSSGVNLPARRVIIRSPLFGGKQMNSLTYKQMIGRAGRTGQDTLGESVLICTEQNSKTGIDLLTAEMKPIVSCLDAGSSSHLKRALLEVISSNVVRTQDDIDKFVECTLLNAQSDLEDQHVAIKESLEFLKEYEFIRVQTDEETSEVNYTATRLGNACLSSSLAPADGLILFSELQKSRKCFVLESELHAIYLVTPFSVSYQLPDLDWLMFLEFWEKLSPAMRKVGEIVGVSEAFLVKAMRGQSKLEDKKIKIHKRFYTALALNELVNETPINTIATKYNCNRGLLQSLQQTASTFAGIVTTFCNSLNFQNLSLILSQFKERLFFGVHRDLIDLMRLPDINYKRARALFDAGCENLVALANSNILEIEKILFNSSHFETDKKLENEEDYEANQRLKERNFFITGKKGMTIQEASKMFIEDARRFVQYEIGVNGIKWENSQAIHEETCSRKRRSTDSNDDVPNKTLKQYNDNKESFLECPSKKVESIIRDRIIPTSKPTQSSDEQIHKLKTPESKSSETKQIMKESLDIKITKHKELSKAITRDRIKPTSKPRKSCDEQIHKLKTPEIKSSESKQIMKESLEKNFTKHKESSKAVTRDRIKPTSKPRKSGDEQIHKLKTPEIKSFETKQTMKESLEIKITQQQESPKAKKPACASISPMKSHTPISSVDAVPSTPKQMPDQESDDDQILCSQNQKELQKTQCSRLLRSTRAKQKSPALRKPTTLLKEYTKSKLEDRFKPSANSTESCISIPEVAKQEAPEPTTELAEEQSFSPMVNSTKLEDNSEFSIENSIIKNPKLLNASHILSASKQETKSSSFDRIHILDICGDKTLFENAVQEILEMKSFGLSLAIQRLPTRIQNQIGGNLLINQQRNGNPEEKFQYHIDQESYLQGFSICFGDNVSLFFDLQLQNHVKCLEFLNQVLSSKELTISIFDTKDQLKVLREACSSLDEFKCKFEDPKVANWLLQPDKSFNLLSLAQLFSPECIGLTEMFPKNKGYFSIGMDHGIGISGKIRSSVEACVTVNVLKGQIENLQRIGEGELYKFFTEMEMPTQIALYKMEVVGFPTNEESLRKLSQEMQINLKKLENRIFEVNGSKFQLGSSAAVAKVLGLHRKANGRVCTSKQILEKIDSPISNLIMTYRKLAVALSKNILPLLKAVKNDRIHSQSISFTSTGRISIHEPNLQNVAKDFEVNLGNEKKVISCRSTFSPETGKCLISSDFCQLEMRILAHLSEDEALLAVMNSESDIFTAISAKWHQIQESDVSEQLRNGTKQICYGIIYGMGMKSLADSLKCTEQEATMLSEQFHLSYPGIRLYIQKVLKFAKGSGYVETITGRRRYLDQINSAEPQARSQAERQAVNSTIQGSAADLVKKAFIKVEQGFAKYISKVGCRLTDINFVLHLHDELLFEVPFDKSKKIAKIIKFTMENSVRLSVPLKVKVKVGKSWGELQEIKV